jgi:hypothetical protein
MVCKRGYQEFAALVDLKLDQKMLLSISSIVVHQCYNILQRIWSELCLKSDNSSTWRLSESLEEVPGFISTIDGWHMSTVEF